MCLVARPPNYSNANNARNVNTDGSLNNNNAYNGNNGVRPDLMDNRDRVTLGVKAETHHQRKVHPFFLGKGDKHKNADAKALDYQRTSYIRYGVIYMYYERIYDFDNLHKAFKLARRGKRWKPATARFEVGLLENLLRLSRELQDKTYTLSEYHTFKVYEPKERAVMSNSFRDKVVQHSLCDNALEVLLTKNFIYDNYASQKGKGTDFGLERLDSFMHKFYRKHGADGWVLKCDIRKYFYRIPHEYLKRVLEPYIPEEDLKWLLWYIIDSTDDPGIPIGNQSSQLLAVLALSPLDHFIKEKLGIKYYGRYMDDFYLIHHDKMYLKQCLRDIRMFLAPMGMELNEKTQIFPLKNGIDFLGFHIYITETGKTVWKLRHRSKHNMSRKLRKFRSLLDKGQITKESVYQSYQSWRGHALRGNCHHLVREMDGLFYELFKEDFENVAAFIKPFNRCEGEVRQVSGELGNGTGNHLDNSCQKP